MKYLCIITLFLLFGGVFGVGRYWRTEDRRRKEDLPKIILLLNSSWSMIRDTDDMIERSSTVRLNSIRSIPFEVGYLMYNIQEEYRRMVDKYNTCVTMDGRLYYHELMMYLEDIEYHYWKIEHLANMIHEIERKYGQKGQTIDVVYHDPKIEKSTEKTTRRQTVVVTRPPATMKRRLVKKTRKPKPTKPGKLDSPEDLRPKRFSSKKPKWWPREYGWEIDYYW